MKPEQSGEGVPTTSGLSHRFAKISVSQVTQPYKNFSADCRVSGWKYFKIGQHLAIRARVQRRH